MVTMSGERGEDLSKLRITRDESTPGSGRGGAPRVRTALLMYGIGAVVIVLGVLFLIRTVTDEPPTVEIATVSYVSPSMALTSLTASGYVVAQRKAALASKATGRIVALYFAEGDRVGKGEIIARIESDDVAAALEQARAELALARATLFDARRVFGRADTLLERNLISQAEFDAAKSAHDGAVALVRSREASVTVAEVALENTNIRAPFDGTVLTKNADVGEVVAPFAAGASSRVAVVTIADMASLQVEADVSESNITGVSLRQSVEVTLDAYPERRYRGMVDKIVPTADRAKATVMTKIRFLEKDERVLPEMGAKVHFLREPHADSASSGVSLLAVDARAIVRLPSGSSVFLFEGGSAKLTTVTTGKTVGGMVEITSGLSQGMKVIVSPPETLSDGGQVRLKN